MKKKINHRSKWLSSAIALMIISISVAGGDCSKILENGGSVSGDIIGNWKLVEQTGALQDICPDETANFQSTGVAQLTCPNTASINRNYSVSNNVLTYTETAVEYDIEFDNNNANLILYGRNVSRNLKYEKIVAATEPITGKTGNDNFNNSSEAVK